MRIRSRYMCIGQDLEDMICQVISKGACVALSVFLRTTRPVVERGQCVCMMESVARKLLARAEVYIPDIVLCWHRDILHRQATS